VQVPAVFAVRARASREWRRAEGPVAWVSKVVVEQGWTPTVA